VSRPGPAFKKIGSGRPRSIKIGILAYNEEKTIGTVLRRALSISTELKKDFEVELVVVDDASVDATGDIARALGATVLSHEKNRGYGASVRTFLTYALRSGADIVVLMDADGQHPPEEIPRLIEPVLHGEADVVIGSRFLNGRAKWMPALKRIGIMFYSLLTSILVRKRITDVTSGFRAMNRRAVEVVAPVYPDDYPAVKVTICMGMRGLRIMEVPVRMSPRGSGSSYIRGSALLSYHLRVIKHIIMALVNR